MTTHAIEPAGTPEESGPGGLTGVRAAGAGGDVLRLRLDVAYDGTAFCGWARQPGLRSVQGALETALRTALRIDPGVDVRVAVAGRTDAGVHATGQVCHAEVPVESWEMPPSPSASDGPTVARRLNGLLAHDVRVLEVAVAPVGFDARWSASWRRYSYRVADDPAGQDPRTRGHVLWSARALDVDAMHAAAQAFLGEHDFAAYCRARQGTSTVRTIHETRWRRLAPRDPVEFTVRADAFCHSMVRSLVGASLAVGEGRWPVERPGELLGAGERVSVIATAPAHGLTLVEVGYPDAAELAAQAQRARRWRGR